MTDNLLARIATKLEQRAIAYMGGADMKNPTEQEQPARMRLGRIFDVAAKNVPALAAEDRKREAEARKRRAAQRARKTPVV